MAASTTSKLVRNDRMVLGGTAIGLSADAIATAQDRSITMVNRRRQALLKLFGETSTPHLIVRVIHDDMLSLFDRNDRASAVNIFHSNETHPAVTVHSHLHEQPLSDDERALILDAVRKYPRVESTWNASGRSPGIWKLQDRVGLRFREVSGPLMLILAVAADLGQIKPEDLPKPAAKPVTRIADLGYDKIRVIGPGNVQITLVADGHVFKWDRQ